MDMVGQSALILIAFTKDNLKTIRHMDLEFTTGMVAFSLWESGKMVQTLASPNI